MSVKFLVKIISDSLTVLKTNQEKLNKLRWYFSSGRLEPM